MSSISLPIHLQRPAQLRLADERDVLTRPFRRRRRTLASLRDQVRTDLRFPSSRQHIL